MTAPRCLLANPLLPSSSSEGTSSVRCQPALWPVFIIGFESCLVRCCSAPSPSLSLFFVFNDAQFVVNFRHFILCFILFCRIFLEQASQLSSSCVLYFMARSKSFLGQALPLMCVCVDLSFDLRTGLLKCDYMGYAQKGHSIESKCCVRGRVDGFI